MGSSHSGQPNHYGFSSHCLDNITLARTCKRLVTQKSQKGQKLHSEWHRHLISTLFYNMLVEGTDSWIVKFYWVILKTDGIDGSREDVEVGGSVF